LADSFSGEDALIKTPRFVSVILEKFYNFHYFPTPLRDKRDLTKHAIMRDSPGLTGKSSLNTCGVENWVISRQRQGVFLKVSDDERKNQKSKSRQRFF
jgi:hypothetical protein